MSDSGLSTRLRQQSRRAGLMVGITMVLAMAILIFGAAGLFAWLSRPFSDLIPVVAPAANAPVVEAPQESAEQPVATSEPAPVIEVEPTAAAPAAPTVAPNTEAFEPTHQISANQSVNFRTGPATSDPVIIALSPATALEFLDEDEQGADGARWMRFRTEDGQEGWVREDLTVPYQP
ncbi:MAG: SH3 domain-containing protein [Thermomicrobiales bacterium]